MVVATPVDDALFDGFGLEVLGEGFVDECGELIIGGEAEGDELLAAEIVDVGPLFGGKKRMESETLFKADDAVLNDKGAVAGATGHDEEDERHGDPPEEKNPVLGPVMDGDIDGEDEVE